MRQNLLRNQASYKELNNEVSTSNAISISLENATPGDVSKTIRTRVKLPKLKLKMLDTDSGDE